MSKVLLGSAQKSTKTLTTSSTSTTTTTPLMMPSKQYSNSTAAVNGRHQHPISNGHDVDGGGDADRNSIDFDDFTCSSSILEFLSKEQECCSETDAESIFQEVSRLADNSDTRSVDEILREAELLIQKQSLLGGGGGGLGVAAKQVAAAKANVVSKTFSKPKNTIKMNAKYTKKIENISVASAKVFDVAARRRSPSPKRENVSVSRSQSQSLVASTPTPLQTPTSAGLVAQHFTAFVDNMPSESVLSDESTPKDLETYTATEKHFPDNDDTDDGSDTMEDITEGIATMEMMVNAAPCFVANGANVKNFNASNFVETFEADETTNNTSASASASSGVSTMYTARAVHAAKYEYGVARPLPHCESPMRRAPLNFNASQICSPPVDVELQRRNSATTRRASMQTPDSGIGGGSSQAQSTQTSLDAAPYASNVIAPSLSSVSAMTRCFIDKSTNSSPKHLVSSVTSPIESFSAITREHALKQDIEQLQEKLKDTEERLQSLRLQHDSLSQLHRDLRESDTQLQEQTEMLKLDVQHLNECANVLRSELQSSRHDRNEALELQRVLQSELEESRQEKRRALELKEKDTRTIQDLQRQCREMERILMRKHPDSVSALIVASKSPGKMLHNGGEESNSSRKLLEQRIAQLESDAKEQDKKAQQILANVQARFNSVQSKYETHIADLETQVLSLQEINTKLNEKIESQVRTLDYFVTKKAERYYNNCTQTDETIFKRLAGMSSNEIKPCITAGTQTAKACTRDHCTNTIACSTTTTNSSSHPQSASSSTSSTANSTPNNSRPNSKQSGLRKPIATASGSLTNALASKLPISQSDSTISLSTYHHVAAKEDAHLLATIRGMRVDLAIKDKSLQRLSRELDECKKTIRKLQKDATKSDKMHGSGSSIASTSRRSYDAAHYAANEQTPANTESQALKEAQSKIKLLEADYKSLHDKRLQDLKTLQSAHERELSSCHETVRILQQRLNERDEAFAMQKRRKVPVDYYALKAKVSSLERRHSEREERLHLLVEALSKGRLNSALEDLLGDNNNQ